MNRFDPAKRQRLRSRQSSVVSDQQRLETPNPQNLYRQYFTINNFVLPNGNEKRQPEAAIETATRKGKTKPVMSDE